MIRIMVGVALLSGAFFAARKIFMSGNSGAQNDGNFNSESTGNNDGIAEPFSFKPYNPIAGTDYSVVETAAASFGGGDSLVSGLGQIVKKIFTMPAGAAPYREAIDQAEKLNGIPSGMLGRLLYQESRFRAEIISGKLKSSTGATGIAQFMPATAAELGVNPYDAFSSIAGAGRYLAKLYKSLGTWDKALAAYNWGIGNVRRKGLAEAPKETRDYISQIMSDLGLA